MSFFGKIFDQITGRDAIRQGEKALTGAANQAITEQRGVLPDVTNYFQPYTSSGTSAVNQYSQLLTPQGQQDFIQNNPFYQAQANDITSRIFSNQAARGKLNSTGTQQEIAHQLLLLGPQLVQQQQQALNQPIQYGYGGATALSGARQDQANSISDLLLQKANARAAGKIGRYNSTKGFVESGLKLAGGFL